MRKKTGERYAVRRFNRKFCIFNTYTETLFDMEKRIKIYDLHDPQQYEDDREFWRNKTPREKLQALEMIRSAWYKFESNRDENQQRLRRVFRIIEQK
jgi:hypothetical protein